MFRHRGVFRVSVRPAHVIVEAWPFAPAFSVRVSDQPFGKSHRACATRKHARRVLRSGRRMCGRIVTEEASHRSFPFPLSARPGNRTRQRQLVELLDSPASSARDCCGGEGSRTPVRETSSDPVYVRSSRASRARCPCVFPRVVRPKVSTSEVSLATEVQHAVVDAHMSTAAAPIDWTDQAAALTAG